MQGNNVLFLRQTLYKGVGLVMGGALAPHHRHGWWQKRLLTRIIPVSDNAVHDARKTTVAAAHIKGRAKAIERGKI